MNCKKYFFDKAQYIAGDEIVLSCNDPIASPKVEVFELNRKISFSYLTSDRCISLSNIPVGNYGIKIIDEDSIWEGAFDVVTSQRKITRYGFLSDFYDENENTDDIEWMKDLHINAVQFYDWMYRHDNLIPQSDFYEDPLGRKMSARCLKRKIDVCKKYGIRPFAYGAVYAATKDFFQENPQWGMYTLDGKPMVFANWLNFMNVSATCGWSNHIIEEYRKSIEYGFEGIHMDTYGFPKYVWDYAGKKIELEEEFPRLINRADETVRKQNENAGVIFNAVNNWPTQTVSDTNQDSVYIEVWPPHDSYYDLYTLIRDAKHNANKPVILAAYLKPFEIDDYDKAFSSLRLSLASIWASGGTQLIFGENKSVLKDSYYANYGSFSEDSLEVIQRYCDFLVRYAGVLYDDEGMDVSKTSSCGINEDICILGDVTVSPNASEDSLWAICRKSTEMITINLVNLCGNDNFWNQGKNQPHKATGLNAKIRIDRKIKSINYASPDDNSISSIELKYDYQITDQGRIYSFCIPDITYFGSVWIVLEE